MVAVAIISSDTLLVCFNTVFVVSTKMECSAKDEIVFLSSPKLFLERFISFKVLHIFRTVSCKIFTKLSVENTYMINRFWIYGCYTKQAGKTCYGLVLLIWMKIRKGSLKNYANISTFSIIFVFLFVIFVILFKFGIIIWILAIIISIN